MSKKDRLRRKKRKNLKAGGLNPPADLSFALTETEETAADTIPAETEPADMGPAPETADAADTAYAVEEPALTGEGPEDTGSAEAEGAPSETETADREEVTAESEEKTEEAADPEAAETPEELPESETAIAPEGAEAVPEEEEIPADNGTEETAEGPADAVAEEASEETAETDAAEKTEGPADTEAAQTEEWLPLIWEEADEPAETGETTGDGDHLELVFADLFEEPVRMYEPPTPRFYRVGKKLACALVAVLLGLTAAYNLGYTEVIETEIDSYVIEPVKVVETMPEEEEPSPVPAAEPQQEQSQEILDALSFTDADIAYKKTVVYLTYDGNTVEFMFDEPSITVRTLLNTAGVTLENEDTVEPGMNRTLGDRDSVKVTRIRHEEYTETVTIPATTEIKLTPLLKAGRTKELNQSSKHSGEKVLTYRDEYINGELTKHEVISEKVTKEPGRSLTLQGAAVTMSAINGAKYTDVMISGNAPTSYERLITGYCTAYNFNKGCWGASGMYLSQGFVAVDPDVIPYGSLLYITNSDGSFVYGWAIAADFCEAASWGWISVDLFFDTYEESVLFGKHTMNIYIVKQLYRDELQQFVARQGYFDARVPARPAPAPEPEPEPEEPAQTEEPEAPDVPEVPEQTEEPEQPEEPAETAETEVPEQSAEGSETPPEGETEGTQ